MASAATQPYLPEQFSAQGDNFAHLQTAVTSKPQATKAKPRDIVATFNYFKENEDGSPPAPSYVNKPETYFRPTQPLQVVVHDIRGSEDQYTLDTKGFQVVKHVSGEKEFLDDDQIKRVYYPETE